MKEIQQNSTKNKQDFRDPSDDNPINEMTKMVMKKRFWGCTRLRPGVVEIGLIPCCPRLFFYFPCFAYFYFLGNGEEEGERLKEEEEEQERKARGEYFRGRLHAKRRKREKRNMG